MPFKNWIKEKYGGNKSNKNLKAMFDMSNKNRPPEPDRRVENGANKASGENIHIVYLASGSPLETLSAVFRTISDKDAEIFTSEEDFINFVSNISDKKIFLVVDNQPSQTLLTALKSLSQVDSLFIYSTKSDNESENEPIGNSHILNRCQDEEALANAIRETRDELDKQTAAFSLYNQKEKATRDLSKESGSFLFFQLFKTVLMNMPKTTESKEMMLARCREYYRGNAMELANIAEFDLTYRSSQAIQWYTKESFVYKFINKALRTEDVEVLYHFRFYIIDLCKQLEMKFDELKSTQNGVIKLYRGLKLARHEVANFEQNIGNLISTNGYLSTSSLRSVAYSFAKKPISREGLVSALFEYQVDLNSVKKIVLADIAKYSAFPEEAEMLVDIGASFRIESCTFDEEDNLWHVIVQATDQGAALASEYIEYQKKKMADANIVLMFGHLLVEMGEYGKAEKYFDTVLASNPNDEEIACIYFNFGRAYRLKGHFDRSMECYLYAYNLHDKAKPKRLASAAKALNGVGVSESELGNQEKAIACFNKALKLLQKSVQRNHIDIAGTLINLASIHCERKEYDLALKNALKAVKIYKRSLPTGHSNNALAMVSLGNIYLCKGQYDAAIDEYSRALKIQETTLPSNHPDKARTMLNIGLTYAYQDDMIKATEYFNHAADIALQTLPLEHPLVCLIRTNQTRSFNSNDSCIIIIRL